MVWDGNLDMLGPPVLSKVGSGDDLLCAMHTVWEGLGAGEGVGEVGRTAFASRGMRGETGLDKWEGAASAELYGKLGCQAGGEGRDGVFTAPMRGKGFYTTAVAEADFPWAIKAGANARGIESRKRRTGHQRISRMLEGDERKLT